MDGRSQHWKHESFSIVRDRESGPIRLLRGDFPQETWKFRIRVLRRFWSRKGCPGKDGGLPGNRNQFLFLRRLFCFQEFSTDPRPEQPGITRWMVQWIPVSLEEQLGEMALTQLFPNRQTCSTPKGDRALETLMLSLIPRDDPYRYKLKSYDLSSQCLGVSRREIGVVQWFARESAFCRIFGRNPGP